MPGRAIIIMNPASGAARHGRHRRAIERLRQAGLTVELWPTERPLHATELARKAAQLSPRFVMAAGGDGTINEVLNGLVRTETPMAVLPMGTANVLALEARIPLDPVRAAEFALDHQPRTISLGRLEVKGSEPRYFCLWVGAGFDAAVVHNVDPRLKKLFGKLAFVISGLTSFARWTSPVITVNGAHSCQSVFVCRASKYAGSFLLARGADISKPGFRVCLLGGTGRRHVLALALGVAFGAHERLGFVHMLDMGEINMEGEGHLHIDGDYFGRLPARIAPEPDSLRLIY